MKMNSSVVATSSIELHHAGLRLALRPDLGGCIAGFWANGEPVLRSTEPAALESARQSGCFAMLPYSNRLGFRRFDWQGQHYGTAQNFDGSPHSLHGVTWQREWQVLEQSAAALSLGYQHKANAHWPFDFEARQDFSLSERSLKLGLSLTNTAPRNQPAGLGWHPYFPLRAQSRLAIAVSSRWLPDALQLPQQREAVAGIDAAVSALDLDHCFEGWQGGARIADERYRLNLTSSLERLVVFTPPGLDFYCVEPVSHVNNAINAIDPLAQGLQALEPAQTLRAEMTLEIESR